MNALKNKEKNIRIVPNGCPKWAFFASFWAIFYDFYAFMQQKNALLWIKMRFWRGKSNLNRTVITSYNFEISKNSFLFFWECFCQNESTSRKKRQPPLTRGLFFFFILLFFTFSFYFCLTLYLQLVKRLSQTLFNV